VIAFVRGRVAAQGPGWVHVDVGGIGYLSHVPDAGRLPPVGESVMLHTVLLVREDALDLYGFLTRAERELFSLLCAVSGVGPKTALALLGLLPPDRLRRAVLNEDVGALTTVPGVGRKTAQRLILELKDRLGGVAGTEAESAPAAVGGQEAVQALLALGYSSQEAVGAVAAAERDGVAETGELIRRALRHLGGAA
jgi:Holliday junction DNA helicase RuvA